MFARFMRFFPAYTLELVLAMRARRFFALNAQINKVMNEEEMRQLSIHHNGKPEDRMRQLASELGSSGSRSQRSSASRLEMIAKGDAAVEQVPGEIEAERERQRLISDEIKKDPTLWLQKLKEQRALELAGQG